MVWKDRLKRYTLVSHWWTKKPISDSTADQKKTIFDEKIHKTGTHAGMLRISDKLQDGITWCNATLSYSLLI
jgi:hypothetical protein